FSVTRRRGGEEGGGRTAAGRSFTPSRGRQENHDAISRHLPTFSPRPRHYTEVATALAGVLCGTEKAGSTRPRRRAAPGWADRRHFRRRGPPGRTRTPSGGG